MTRPGAVAGLLLTGGASRRLGIDKATLVVEGERLADRAARLLRAVADPVLEIGPGFSALPAVREPALGLGPLSALVAGGRALAAQGHDGPALLLAVDLPFVTTELLALLATWPGDPEPAAVVPRSGERDQPVCARYGRVAFTTAAALLAAGERSLGALLDALDVARVPEASWRSVAPADALADLDTPADLARFGIPMPG